MQERKPPRNRVYPLPFQLRGLRRARHISSPLGTRLHEHPLLAPVLSEATRAALAADVASRAISMPMRREVRRLIEADVQAWARRARITEDAPPTVVEG